MAGNDTLTAYGNDVLDGGDGNDVLKGGIDVYTWNRLQTTFIGGKGNDTITGSSNREIYSFSLGDGIDTISQDSISSPDDELRFGPGISATDITVLQAGFDLILRHANGTDQITIKSWFSYDSSQIYTHQFGQIKFNDNTTWTAAQVNALAVLPPAGGPLNGTTGADSLTGSAGNDVINGLARQ